MYCVCVWVCVGVCGCVWVWVCVGGGFKISCYSFVKVTATRDVLRCERDQILSCTVVDEMLAEYEGSFVQGISFLSLPYFYLQ